MEGSFDMLCQMKISLILLIAVFSTTTYAQQISPCCEVKSGNYCLLLDKSNYKTISFLNPENRVYKLKVCDKDGYVVESYDAVLGIGGEGNKQFQADGKVPEGVYNITQKSDKKMGSTTAPHQYHKYFLIDYPNADNNSTFQTFLQDKDSVAKGKEFLQDRLNKAKSQKDKSNIAYYTSQLKSYPKIGGAIEIHGTRQDNEKSVDLGDNWTDGCISLRNSDIDNLYRKIDVGTTIEIRPAAPVKQ